MNARPRIGVCGLGLIGGSLAKQLSRSSDVMAIDPDPDAMNAARAYGVTRATSLRDLADCELVVLAAPTAVNQALLADLAAIGIHAPVIDLGSVKQPIERTWLANPEVRFVGTHPMAGAEQAGFAAGDPDLFKGAAWAVVPHESTDPAALLDSLQLICGTGAFAVPTSSAGHDRAVATISHLPHVLAALLGGLVADSADPALTLELAAGSFRDATRVSASPPERTAEFLTQNKEALVEVVDLASRRLAAVGSALTDQEEVVGVLRQGAAVRAAFDHPLDPTIRTLSGSAAQCKLALLGLRDSGSRVMAVSQEGDQFTLQVTGPRNPGGFATEKPMR